LAAKACIISWIDMLKSKTSKRIIMLCSDAFTFTVYLMVAGALPKKKVPG
jgi:hypothetical protein